MDISSFSKEGRRIDTIEKNPAPADSENDTVRDALMTWKAPEHELAERDHRWHSIILVVLLVIIAYAIFTNSPIMAITFILIGIVGYILINKPPRIIDFSITPDGIIADKELYAFENMYSFWIFYESNDLRVISLHSKGQLLPFVHIPIDDQDPVEIRDHLLRFLPEVKQEPSFLDTFERLLGI